MLYKMISICYVQSCGKDPTSDVRSSPRKSTLISQLLQAMSLVTLVAVVAPFFCYALAAPKGEENIDGSIRFGIGIGIIGIIRIIGIIGNFGK